MIASPLPMVAVGGALLAITSLYSLYSLTFSSHALLILARLPIVLGRLCCLR